VDQYNNNSENEFLWKLLANPANDANVHTFDLQRLVSDFPQSGILQALLAHASDDKNLKQASVYFSPKALYKLINTPASFVGVADEKIILQKNLGNNGYHYEYEQYPPIIENTFSFHDPETASIATTDSENYFNETTVIELDAQLYYEAEENSAVHEIVAEPFAAAHETEQHLTNVVTETETAAPVEEPVVAEKETLPMVDAAINQIHPDVPAETSEVASTEFTDKLTEELQPVAEVQHITGTETADKNIEEEVFEEIAGVEDFNINESLETPKVVEEPKDEIYRPSFAPNLAEPRVNGTLNEDKQNEDVGDAEKLITESIASNDYFMFDNTLVEEPQSVEQTEIAPKPVMETTPDVEVEKTADESVVHDDAEQQDVSKYHDEKMPYTFMWWLDKTRQEHASIYQPYVKAREVAKPVNAVKKQPDELQQQYYENIFHITSVEELDKATAPKAPADIAAFKRKEHFIIERFIKEEPQIRPQSSDKLDNENKAKKSSEDRDELVTETLASIYTDQMLYHKAIASYKKLMLKFPEKSRYFAAKIEQLEKKTN